MPNFLLIDERLLVPEPSKCKMQDVDILPVLQRHGVAYYF